MNSNYDYRAQYSTPAYDPTNLQPLLSSLAQYLAVALVLVGYYYTVGSNSYRNVREVVHMSISSILSGRAFNKSSSSSLDWTSPQNLGVVDAKGKAIRRRRYIETDEGREAWDAANLHFPGLLNAAGNLCFLNATLQSMASLPTLISYLDSLLLQAENLSSSASSSALALPVTSALHSTLTALNTPSTSSRPHALRPLLLASALADSSESRRRLLKSSEQQDAHELWGMIRDAVEEESIKLAKFVEFDRHVRAGGNGLNEIVALRTVDTEESGAAEASARPMSPSLSSGGGRKRRATSRNDPWFWLRSQRIKCMNCGYVRDTRHEGEELLMLNVPPVSSCSIYDLLQEYTKPDLLSEYACRKCSMVLTLEKYKSQRDRLAGLIPPAAVTSPQPTPNSFDLPTPATKGDTKMTTSRKERKRKVGKLVERIQEVVDAGDYEKPLEDESGIKMERVGTAAGKSVNIARTPEILLIHVNRSTHYGYSGPIKNSCQVTFPEFLDLSPFCDHPTPVPSASRLSSSAASTRDLYRLSSMVVHYGSHHFGHYVAFRRRPQRPRHLGPDDGGRGRGTAPRPALPEWYRISDETVDVSTIEEATRNNPFLLFYERVRVDDRDGDANGSRDHRHQERTEVEGSVEDGERRNDQAGADNGAGSPCEARLRPRVVESWQVRSREAEEIGDADETRSSVA